MSILATNVELVKVTQQANNAKKQLETAKAQEKSIYDNRQAAKLNMGYYESIGKLFFVGPSESPVAVLQDHRIDGDNWSIIASPDFDYIFYVGTFEAVSVANDYWNAERLINKARNETDFWQKQFDTTKEKADSMLAKLDKNELLKLAHETPAVFDYCSKISRLSSI